MFSNKLLKLTQKNSFVYFNFIIKFIQNKNPAATLLLREKLSLFENKTTPTRLLHHSKRLSQSVKSLTLHLHVNQNGFSRN